MGLNDKERLFLEQVFLEMAANLTRYAYASVKDWDIAEELLQTVFHVACEKVDFLTGCENPGAWLFATMKYKLVEYHRARNRSIDLIRKAMEHMPEPMDYTEIQLDVDTLYGSAAIQEDLALLTRLYIEGSSMREIADEDQITIETCKKRIQRARKRLAAYLEESGCV